jgi:precorrin-4/cobalt-precorrin-4 C11-methyltransferase
VELTVPQLVQTIILTRVSGRTHVPTTEELETLAAHRASLCLYLSARHIEAAQAKLMHHYEPDLPIAICYRLGWPDEQIQVVPLKQMAEATQAHNLIRTTLYIISPALKDWAQDLDPETGQKPVQKRRSQLYNPSHDHLFRPQARASQA